MSNKVIAVDFDGTLCDADYPNIGKPHRDVISRLIDEQYNGAKIILWTCRCGEDLRKAVEWCATVGLYFDAVNDNLPERTALYGCNSRKINADEYWDDKAVRL